MTQHSDGHNNVLQFRRLVDSDPALQAQIASHVGDGSWNSAAIVAIGKARGLDFAAEDLIAIMEDDGELSDFELELVAAAAPMRCFDPKP